MLHFKAIEPIARIREIVVICYGSPIGIYGKTLSQYDNMANEKFRITNLILEKLKNA